MSQIEVHSISPVFADEIVDFFNSDFAKNEPISQSLFGLNDSTVFHTWIRRLVEGGLCFEAIDGRAGNKRVGALLTSIYRKGEKNPIDEELESMEMDYTLATLVDVLHSPLPKIQSQIFSHYKKHRYLDGVFLSVLSSYGGQGIAGQLIEAAEHRAQELGVEAVLFSATSQFTAGAVSKRGYQIIHTFPYEKYLQEGKRVLFTRTPHVAANFCVKIFNYLVDIKDLGDYCK